MMGVTIQINLLLNLSYPFSGCSSDRPNSNSHMSQTQHDTNFNSVSFMETLFLKFGGEADFVFPVIIVMYFLSILTGRRHLM